ncbi:hypothetical protein SAMN05660359_00434 [Geodermatophilus obscurus]|jgi:hypothetical protein|uniref:Uncharacterized protein n=1 Tax=Geodermatophilus obscurus TaxID=1861 RepID=A0A1I5CP10_9ACTN|nr:hypothetical protein [Geodermatophilus obscurus]SFN88642.1 hypothetical protein SAMN05660359_00434 [Geodermatophilus obscurus]
MTRFLPTIEAETADDEHGDTLAPEPSTTGRHRSQALERVPG